MLKIIIFLFSYLILVFMTDLNNGLVAHYNLIGNFKDH